MAKANERNPKDRNGRGGHTVLAQHKGKVAKTPPKMKNLQRKSGNR